MAQLSDHLDSNKLRFLPTGHVQRWASSSGGARLGVGIVGLVKTVRTDR